MSIPGPAALGRSVVITGGQPVPPAWSGAPVHQIGDATLADPGPVVTALHQAWTRRLSVVIALSVDPGRFREPESWPAAPWTLPASFEAWWDRLHFLVWANAYDARADLTRPVWWWARKAARLSGVGGLAAEAPGDVLLPDASAAWIDGGPRSTFSPSETDGLTVVHCESVELGRLTPVPEPADPSADLAADQLAAVAHRAGAARIIAPAGSGKTRVLTERLRHLVVDRGYERESVLAVAYNKKAQEELEARCADFRPRVRTLNSVGYLLLADARGAAPRVLEEREVRRQVEQLIPIRRHRANADPIGPYLEALGQIRLGLRDPEEVEAGRDDVPGLAAAFEPYRAALRDADVVDFDEQVYGAVEALLADGAFRRRAQAGCRHMLVDEFQDLTSAHVLMLRLLASPQLDVFGVGDDDQVIYGHAGADPGFLIGFEGLFPGAGDHPLEVNYRCPAPVVEQAVTLLSYNQRRVNKTIRAGPEASASTCAGPVQAVQAVQAMQAVRVVRHRPSAGAEAVVDVVAAWLGIGSGSSGPVQPTSIAVLTRVNALLLAPQVALVEAGIPVASVLRSEVLERTGLRAALSYLRIGVAPPGRIATADIVEILRRPSRGLPQWFPDRIRRRNWWSIDQLWGLAGAVPDKEASRVERLVDDLSAVVAAGAAPSADTRSILAAVKDGVGLGGAMGLLDNSKGGEGSSHLDDLDALEQVAGLHPTPGTFESWLRDALARPASDAGVTLSTIHRVKGMEWAKVVVFGVNAGILPHRLAEDEEEERRVLHVALTRCQEEVALLADSSRPSPMLAELDGTAPKRPVRPVAEVLTREKHVSSVGPADLSPDVAPAEQALRTWRTARCRRDKVSAFIVLYDRTLRAIATARPTTLVQLSHIDGIGPTKLDLYGDEILAVLADLDG